MPVRRWAEPLVTGTVLAIAAIPFTARAKTFWTEWSDMLGFAWIGLGFTLAPFSGFAPPFARAAGSNGALVKRHRLA